MKRRLVKDLAAWQDASELARAAEDTLAQACADYIAKRTRTVPAILAADVAHARSLANERLAAVLAQIATE